VHRCLVYEFDDVSVGSSAQRECRVRSRSARSLVTALTCNDSLEHLPASQPALSIPQTSCCQLADSVLLALVRLCVLLLPTPARAAPPRPASEADPWPLGEGEGDHPPPLRGLEKYSRTYVRIYLVTESSL